MEKLQTIFTTPGQNEHLEADGLIHCDQCGKPRQVRLNFGEHVQTVRCLCACQQERQEKHHQQLRRQEELNRLARIRSVAMDEPALLKCTFEASAYDSPGIQVARNYVASWNIMEQQGLGLLFWGPPGTGKTFLAACVANAILDQGIPVLMTNFNRMLGAMPGPASGLQTETIDEWMRFPLLIIDDLGAERESPYAIDLVWNIIDSRYRSGKPFIITTNLTMDQMENPGSLEKERIYQRVLERCTPVCVNGVCIRNEKRKMNRDIAKANLK